MKTFDIRRGDVVKFRAGLTDADRTRILKFTRIVSEQGGMSDYVQKNGVINARSRFKVDRCKQTKKKPTEYAVLISKEDIFVPVQTRYLELVSRKPSHPLTNIFQN